ncbi:PAS domain S-box protein, partial [Sphingomonas sp.]|uniref:PAS domain S-box protein n=1 Tax=Sphingomonas sp. TaxID=28214 RepID=UPI003CC53030
MASSIEPSSAADPGALDPQAAREFALIADAAPVPMWTTRADGRRGFVNQCYLDFLGVDREAGLAFDWRTILHPDDAGRVRAETIAGAAAGVTFATEARYRRHDGEWRWVRSVSTPRSDAAGAAGGYVGVGHDVTEAKTAELALRSRERQLSVLIDQTAAGLAQIDLSGRFTLVNDRFCAIVGWSRAALMERTARSITHPDDLAHNDAQMAAMLANGEAITTDKRYVRPDGSVVWVSNSVALSRDEVGAPSRVIAISLDITARREAEAAVRASEARLEFLDALGRATAAAVDADAVLAITTRMLGEKLAASDCAYADIEADGDSFHIRGDWHRSDMASIVGSYSLASFGSQTVADLNAGRPLLIEDVAAIEGDGAAAFRAIGIQATICMPYIKGNRLAALMAVHASVPRRWTDEELALVREVTARSWAHVDRVRAEAALRDSERQLRLAVAGARIGTWDWDPVTQRGGWSPRTAEIMGMPHERVLTEREQAEMVHPDDRARVAAGSAALALAGTDFATEYRIIRPDGQVRWVASHGLVMRDAAGGAVRVIGTLRDVTARRRAQEALTALNQTLEAQVAERTAERDRMWNISADLMLVIDFEGVFRRVNPAWTALLGYTAEELVGHHVNEFVLP